MPEPVAAGQLAPPQGQAFPYADVDIEPRRGTTPNTNVISQASSAEPGPKVVSFVADQPLESLHINVITLVEIRFAIEVLADVILPFCV